MTTQDTTTTRRYLFDSANQAKPNPQCLEALALGSSEGWADARKIYHEGRHSSILKQATKETVAQAITETHPKEVHFSPKYQQAVELLAMALAQNYDHVITTEIEKDIVRKAFAEPRFAKVTTLALSDTGGIVIEDLKDKLEKLAADATEQKTILVIQIANHEIGTIQPVVEISALCDQYQVPLILDASSSFGRIEITETKYAGLIIDTADLGNPCQSAILILKDQLKVSPNWNYDGDPWYSGMAPLGICFAAAIAVRDAVGESLARFRALDPFISRLRKELPQKIDDLQIVGSAENRLPHILTFSCLYVEGETLVRALDEKGFIVASGSACLSEENQPSHVLAALGKITQGNIRISLPEDCQENQILEFIQELPKVVRNIRELLGVL